MAAIKTEHADLYAKAVKQMASLSMHLYLEGYTDTRPDGAATLARLFDVSDEEFLAHVRVARLKILDQVKADRTK